MDLETEVRNNSKDIHALTVNLTKLATMFENSEKRHDSELEIIKSAVLGIEKLDQRISATISMEKDISALKDAFGELKGDVRTVTHDMRSLASQLEIIAHIRERQSANTAEIAKHEVEIKALKEWRDKMDGAAGAIRYIAYVCWAMFGSAILAIGYYIIKLFLKNGGM